MRILAIISLFAAVLLVLGCDPPAVPHAPKGTTKTAKTLNDKKGGGGIKGMSPEDLMLTDAGKHADERLGSALRGR